MLNRNMVKSRADRDAELTNLENQPAQGLIARIEQKLDLDWKTGGDVTVDTSSVPGIVSDAVVRFYAEQGYDVKHLANGGQAENYIVFCHEQKGTAQS